MVFHLSECMMRLLSCPQEAECAYILILMAVYWMTEVLPLSITALLPALLFPLFGIMKSSQVHTPENVTFGKQSYEN